MRSVRCVRRITYLAVFLHKMNNMIFVGPVIYFILEPNANTKYWVLKQFWQTTIWHIDKYKLSYASAGEWSVWFVNERLVWSSEVGSVVSPSTSSPSCSRCTIPCVESNSCWGSTVTRVCWRSIGWWWGWGWWGTITRVSWSEANLLREGVDWSSVGTSAAVVVWGSSVRSSWSRGSSSWSRRLLLSSATSLRTSATSWWASSIIVRSLTCCLA